MFAGFWSNDQTTLYSSVVAYNTSVIRNVRS
jgi:hypothetical protein